MFPIRRIAQVSVYTARQQNKCFSTIRNVDENDKPYPLDGIRVLDLTRIGKLMF